MTALSLIEELNRQIKEELKGSGILEPNRQQEIMMQQKYGLMRPLLTEEELTICLPILGGGKTPWPSLS